MLILLLRIQILFIQQSNNLHTINKWAAPLMVEMSQKANFYILFFISFYIKTKNKNTF